MCYISSFTVDEQELMRLIGDDRSPREIGVEYKLIFRNGLDKDGKPLRGPGSKLDGGSRGWKKATLKRLQYEDDLYSLTLSPSKYILEGTYMDWKIRIEGQKRRWIPPKFPSSWTAIRDWFYMTPPLDELTGRFVVEPTQVSILIVKL